MFLSETCNDDGQSADVTSGVLHYLLSTLTLILTHLRCRQSALTTLSLSLSLSLSVCVSLCVCLSVSVGNM